MWDVISKGNWKEEYEKEEELFEFVSKLQNELAKSIFYYLNKTCVSYLLSNSYRDIWCDNYIDFTYYVIGKGKEYYDKCINDIPFCISESVHKK